MRCHCFSYLCFDFVWSLDLPHYIHFLEIILSILWFSRAFGCSSEKDTLKIITLLYLMLCCNRNKYEIWRKKNNWFIIEIWNCIVCYFHFYIYSHDRNDTDFFWWVRSNHLYVKLSFSFILLGYFVLYQFWLQLVAVELHKRRPPIETESACSEKEKKPHLVIDSSCGWMWKQCTTVAFNNLVHSA